MKTILATAALFAVLAVSPAIAVEKMDKSETMDCTNAGMKEMNTKIEAMPAATNKTMAMDHMKMANDSMMKKDMKECGMHMKEAMGAMEKK